MDRLERSLKRFEDQIDLLKRNVNFSSDSLSKDISALENRLEYFRNRLERSRAQADKIRSDLKNISGPICPSCLESSVNMYCRNSEAMQNDIDLYLKRATGLQTRNGISKKTAIQDTQNDTLKPSFQKYRTLIDSLKDVMPQCDNHVALTLRKQAEINVNRADSLFSHGDTISAMKALHIANSLINKSSLHCKDK